MHHSPPRCGIRYVPLLILHLHTMYATSAGSCLTEAIYQLKVYNVQWCYLQLKKVKDVPRLLHRLRTTLGSTNIHDFQQLLNRHIPASEVPAKTYVGVASDTVSDCFVVRGCSLTALLILRDAMNEAAEQRSSLLDANAQAEQLWGAASESGFQAATCAQSAQTGM